jgi:hypothetical protein
VDIVSQGVAAPALSADVQHGLLAVCSERPELPPDLARLLEAWPKLPEHIRCAILALVDSCK